MSRYIDIDRYSFPTLHQKELNDYMKGWNTCLKSVLQQPTADVVEVRRGEWIKYCTGLYGSNYKCSKCGNLADEDNSGHYAIFTNYCSNCGAKMEGGNK